jgi:2-polyprenyl-3-methyl-5-hydroxy-6-metoxy-1,4-benzoquinol methylase
MKALARSALQTFGLLSLARRGRARCRDWTRVWQGPWHYFQDAIAGWRERLHYLRDQRRFRHAAGGVPIPPANLNFLVSGCTSVPAFVEVGQTVSACITAVLARNGHDLRDCRAILDFGCGCGRVIRYWKQLPAAIHGTDCHAEAIRWCTRNLPFGHFRVNQADPPLSYSANSFDFIYAISVFTHLDERRQHTWVAELARILKPGGLLLITTHGETCLHYVGAADVERFHCHELVVANPEQSGRNACGVFHPYEYVRDRLARNLTLCDFVPGKPGGCFPHDVYLLKKNPMA